MPEDQTTDLITVLRDVRDHKPGAEERLFGIVYDQLRRIAHGQLIREGAGQTLQTTALVNEAYLRLLGSGPLSFENRRHFFGSAALAMRRILIERARRRNAEMRGGNPVRVPLEDNVSAEPRSFDILALDAALDILARNRPRHAEVVGYRYFLGMTVKETASVLGVSSRTVDSDWEFAKSWLKRQIARQDEHLPGGPS